MAQEHLGARVKRLREARGISRRDLAGIWGCTVANISQIETGKRAPSLEQLMQFAGATGVSVDALLSGVALKAS